MSKFYQDDKNPYPQLEKKEQENPYVSQGQQGQQGQQDIFDRHQKAKDPRSSVFLNDAELKKEEEDPGCCGRCCSCCSVEYYKDHFKVTNKIVFDRMGRDLKFWTGGFFQDLKADYDLYGPFWLYTTMVFVCSAVHNVLAYMGNSTSFNYNFGVIGIAFGLFYILGMLLSAVYGLLFGCMGLACKPTHIVCLYGYGMTTYVICVLLCIINMSLLTWLLLLYGAGTKVAFILKNIFEKLEVPGSKKVVIIVLVLIEAGIQLLAIKFALLSPDVPAVAQTTVKTAHFLHLRNHENIL